jgi:hypothetical protein
MFFRRQIAFCYKNRPKSSKNMDNIISRFRRFSEVFKTFFLKTKMDKNKCLIFIFKKKFQKMKIVFFLYFFRTKKKLIYYDV